MRKMTIVLLLILLWVGVGATAALADGMVVPMLLDQSYLTVRYHRVTVRIEDSHAVTRVEQEFLNPQTVEVSARYLFPVPPGAIISRFQATVDGRPQAAVRQDAATTNAALYALVVERQDPSLLQYVDWETLAFDISLPPGGSKRMTLEYEEVLVPTGGLYRYRYVLSTERYSSQPLEEISITVDLHLSAGLTGLHSPNYPVSIERQGPDRARVSWKAEQVRPNEDLDLFFAPARGEFGAGLLAGRRNGQDHFLFLFSPGIELAEEPAIPKDIVFVMDRSGSMSGEKVEQVRSALQYVLGRLGQQDRFSIVSFNHQVSTFARTLRPAGRAALAEARGYVDRWMAEGNTDLDAALQEGLAILARSEARPGATRIVVFLTDGLPTAGLVDDGTIASRVVESNARQKARLHLFGVGYDVNTHLLDRLAVDGAGTVTYVQPGESLEGVLTAFYERIARPVLTDVSVEFEGMEVSDLYPQTMPDLFRGSSLVLAGRCRATADTVRVRVRGRAGDEDWEGAYSFSLKEAGGHDFVPRLWATRRVGALLDRVRVEGESGALVEEIRALGLGYGLVTPYTTFIIEGQAGGAASGDNMALYGRSDLNLAYGQTTVQARVQNQAYQQAVQANMAQGANVLNQGHSSVAQVADLNVDLALLQGRKPPEGPLNREWLERNVGIDRAISFGSPEYLELARNAEVRPFLQSGVDVVFAYNGEVISVQAGEQPAPPTHSSGWQWLPAWLHRLLAALLA